jgi:threonine dehydrogenase-like Zn-dependent dehydrogenase
MQDSRVIYLDPDKLNIEGMTFPGIKPNQLLIETHQASVCGSELTKT